MPQLLTCYKFDLFIYIFGLINVGIYWTLGSFVKFFILNNKLLEAVLVIL